MGIVEGYISEMSADIQQKILGINCIDFYGLNIRQTFPENLV